MTFAAAVLLSLLQAAPEKSEDRRLITVREFIIRVDSKENAPFKALWVSRDGGRTWKTARESGAVVLPATR